MKCGYYWIANPLPSRIVENGSHIPVLQLPIRFKNTEYNVSVFNNNEGRPELIKMTLTGLSSEEIPADFLPFLQTVKEHMLTTLKLSYDSSFVLADLNFSTFSQDDKDPSISVELAWHLIPHFNA